MVIILPLQDKYNMVLFDNSRTLCCLLVFFVAFGNTTTVGDNSDAPDHLLDNLREGETKRSPVTSASLLAKQLHAWRVVLRSAKIVQMEPESLARHQTYYVKSGGLLNAIEDFYSVKPTNVRYFEGSNEVFGRVGTIGVNRKIILQTKLENGIASNPTLRVFINEERDRRDTYADIITYIKPPP